MRGIAQRRVGASGRRSAAEMEPATDVLERRQRDLLEWLADNAPLCQSEQRHLDGGTDEQAYWHFGYLIAIKDMLALLGSASTPRH